MRGAWLSAALGVALVVACSSSQDERAPGYLRPSDIGKACTKSLDCTVDCIPKIGEAVTPTNPGVCSARCTADSDCVAGWSCLVGPAGVDVCQCRVSAERFDGRDNDCDGKVDDDLPPSALPCEKPLFKCGDRCIDLASDVGSCGACGKACGQNTVCAGATCRCVVTGAECDTTKGTKFCGAEGSCRESVALGLPNDFGGTSVPEVVAVGSSFVVFRWTDGSATLKLHRIRVAPFDLVTPMQTFGGGAAMISPRPGVAAEGNDFAYGEIDQPGPEPNPPGKLIACPGGVCGPPIVTGVVATTERLRLSGGKVYWMQGGALRRCALTGCGGVPEDLGVLPSGKPGAFAVDASGVYAVIGSSIEKWTEGTGAFTTLFASDAPSFVAVDNDDVFVATQTGISRCPKSGCAGSATQFASSPSPQGLAVLGVHVYWVSAGTLYRCPKTGACTPQPIASGFSSIAAEDATHLYVPDTLSVRRVSK